MMSATVTPEFLDAYRLYSQGFPDLSDANCGSVGGAAWDLLSEMRTPFSQVAYAINRVCGTCPVREACLEAALNPRFEQPAQRFGIWGGKTPRQREKIFRERYPDGLCADCLRRPTRRTNGARVEFCVECSERHFQEHEQKRHLARDRSAA